MFIAARVVGNKNWVCSATGIEPATPYSHIRENTLTFLVVLDQKNTSRENRVTTPNEPDAVNVG